MCLLEKLKKHIQGDEQEASYRGGYSYGAATTPAYVHTNSYGGESWGGSYNDGRNNSYGHYEANGSIEDKIHSLESMRSEATNETERRMIDEWIQRLRTQRH